MAEADGIEADALSPPWAPTRPASRVPRRGRRVIGTFAEGWGLIGGFGAVQGFGPMWPIRPHESKMIPAFMDSDGLL